MDQDTAVITLCAGLVIGYTALIWITDRRK